MGDKTDLKSFHTTLSNIEKADSKLQMLYDCYNSQEASFSGNAQCLTIDKTNKKVFWSNGTTPYENDNVKLPYEILYSMIDTQNPSTTQAITYNDLFASAGKTGYAQSASMFDVFEQDIVDLSGELNTNKKFKTNDIQTQYSSVRNLRDDLDNKMRDIYNPEVQDEHLSHEQSVYLTLSWTIVATSVLYYLFVKL